jgi:hypothetical protein
MLIAQLSLINGVADPGVLRFLAKIDRPGGKKDTRSRRNTDHVRDADARISPVSWAVSTMPDTTRTTAPASLTSITGPSVAKRPDCRRETNRS